MVCGIQNTVILFAGLLFLCHGEKIASNIALQYFAAGAANPVETRYFLTHLQRFDAATWRLLGAAEDPRQAVPFATARKAVASRAAAATWTRKQGPRRHERQRAWRQPANSYLKTIEGEEIATANRCFGPATSDLHTDPQRGTPALRTPTVSASEGSAGRRDPPRTASRRP